MKRHCGDQPLTKRFFGEVKRRKSNIDRSPEAKVFAFLSQNPEYRKYAVRYEPAAWRTFDFLSFEKQSVQRGELQRSIGFHKENALGLHRCGSRFAAKFGFYELSATCLQLSSSRESTTEYDS
ncbi:MAG: hypothetical protein ACLUHG_02805 [Sutterella wadsworthensis]